jgi:hypothetical protein
VQVGGPHRGGHTDAHPRRGREVPGHGAGGDDRVQLAQPEAPVPRAAGKPALDRGEGVPRPAHRQDGDLGARRQPEEVQRPHTVGDRGRAPDHELEQRRITQPWWLLVTADHRDARDGEPLEQDLVQGQRVVGSTPHPHDVPRAQVPNARPARRAFGGEGAVRRGAKRLTACRMDDSDVAVGDHRGTPQQPAEIDPLLDERVEEADQANRVLGGGVEHRQLEQQALHGSTLTLVPTD